MGRLRQAVRSVWKRLARRGLILLYHRVVELPSDPQLLCVSPQHFAEHLEVLKKYGKPTSLQQLVRASDHGDLPDRTVVVTFDDGYADNLYNARPLLERYDTPATVFVTTEQVGRDREFWWDELDRLVLQPGRLPETLQLSVSGSIQQWELADAASYSEGGHQRLRGWNVLAKEDPGPRQALYRSLCKLLRPLPSGERAQVLDEVLSWAGAEGRGRTTHRILSSDEVSQLAEGDLVEVGAHSMTHPMLPRLTMAEQREEILNSRKRLEDICGRRVVSFAYPYGQASKKTRELVQEAGFTSGCSTIAGTTTRFSDPFWLPRLLVRDWDGERFASELRRAFEG